MEKRLFKIISNALIADKTFKLELQACDSGFSFSGEFVDIQLDGFYLRRPLSVYDYDGDVIRIIYKVVGQGTKALSGAKEGTVLDVLTGLGHGFDSVRCRAAALLVGGGLGSAPLYPVARELRQSGRRVTVVLGFNTAADMVLEQEFRDLGCDVTIATMDGSAGVKGTVTDAIRALNPVYDFFYCCGPVVMMKAVCLELKTDGQVSLEERMGCGSGFCYGCTCKTMTGGAKLVCKDGPVFDKDEVVWN